ncbi:hypothetical protein [Lysinibacillus parviboronicapiens]|uniref:hypothetical protein n=1 Tax=Lysinibacillus parviboronicapiens TaxID=436516 RepID=UPI000D3778D4|nr:hypothetical protein [Lysinibacillus parviboronicapiens]
MKKNLFNPLTLVLVCVLLALATWIYTIMDVGSPDELSKENWPKTEEKVNQATIEHFKIEKDIDVVIEKVSFSGEYAKADLIVIRGNF